MKVKSRATVAVALDKWELHAVLIGLQAIASGTLGSFSERGRERAQGMHDKLQSTQCEV